MNRNFIKICKMSQANLKKYVANRLRETHKDITIGDGFVYAQGTFPVLLVAHLDTVHDNLPDIIMYDANLKVISAPNGIGGDDRCGVYMIFKVLEKFNCSVLFCEDEEKGAIGAGKFIQTDLAASLKFNYIIEFDRKGSNDAVFYDCANQKFEDFICEDFYESSWGTFSDISVLAPFIGCAAVNLSCGYHNAHSKDEYVILPQMDASIEAACKILERTTEDDKFEYIKAKYSYGSGSYRKYSYSNYSGYNNNMDDYNNFSDDKYIGARYYVVEFIDDKGQYAWFDTYANSYYEALGKFAYANPNATYYDITDFIVDNSLYSG